MVNNPQYETFIYRAEELPEVEERRHGDSRWYKSGNVEYEPDINLEDIREEILSLLALQKHLESK